MKTKDIIIIGTGFLVGFFLGKVIWHTKPEQIEVIQVDTVTLWDTVKIDRPVPYKELHIETVYVPVTDTVRLHDTTYVALTRTQKEYRDSLYRAWVSGIDPALDSISVFTPTKYVTTTIREKPDKWHVGVQGGYGISKGGLSPYIGIGLTYSIISF